MVFGRRRDATRMTHYFTYQEAFMTQQTKEQHQKPGQPHSSQEEVNKQKEEVNKQKQKAAEHEVAGRHKNDGKNDHAGYKIAP